MKTKPNADERLRDNTGHSADEHGRATLRSHDHKEQHSHIHSHKHSEHDGHSHSIFGHSHSHSTEDNVFLQEKGGLSNPAIRITWVGLLVNVGMAIGKGVGGVVFHSQALLADSVHAISDLVSDFLTLATVSIGSKPASQYFPNGYGKVETLGSLGVSGILVLAGLSMGWDGLFTMITHMVGDSQWLEALRSIGGHGHSHSHAHDAEGVAEVASLNAAWIALGSIIIKEWLFKATLKVADKTGSPVLVANAWHHRVDSLVSIVAVATIGSGHFFNIGWMDPLGGLLVSSIIVRAGYNSAKSAIYELIDNNRQLMETDIHKLKSHEERIKDTLDLIGTDFILKKAELMPSGPNFLSYVELALRSDSSNRSLDTFSETAKLLREDLISHDRGLKRVYICYDGTKEDKTGK
ncbi:Mmt2p [Sugiyamaella lignohabitans]|uniref:Mmt2p n=1 Tax=Sugiyamaella lignohabitans TaxID=796027 RepID=A0A167CJ63_9ASCO|nr:Mmt2p [Sugiyamaella lignohabitans]ANB11770.1 Mmt2p [Sugiyamaella lignohabitans]